MNSPRFLLTLAVLSAASLHAAAPAVARASPSFLFNDCAYQSDMRALTQGTARVFQAIGKTSTAQFQTTQSQLLARLSRFESTYGTAHHLYARKASASYRAALAAVSTGLDARDLGGWNDYYAQMKRAWADLNSIYRDLQTFCPLGHFATTQLEVSLTGDEYGDGIAPLPLAAPWISVRSSWLIRWSYSCSGAPAGFTIEVRSVHGNPSMLMGDSGVYLGPYLATAVQQRRPRASGTTKLKAFTGPVYLLVKSRCPSTIKVVA